MLVQEITRLHSDLIKTLGQSLTPLIEVGFGNPLLWPLGAVVVEVTDKDSERTYKLPLTATRVGSLILLTSLRRQAGWLQNLMAKPDVRYWFAGRPRLAKAFVLTPDIEPAADLPTSTTCLARLLQQQSRLTGWSFAILAPRN
ncbi:MAG TPA: hypothetical protein VFZ34_09495 [Blastocatellia bacterium]|nr:hypothetical protein [Blastocatellia bacterium]